MKKFFFNTEGKWVIDNGEHYRELLPGDYEPLYTGTKVSIVNLNNNKLELQLTEVSEIGKSEFTSDTYADLDEFKTATKNFFTTAAINEIPTDAQNPVTTDDDSIFVKDIDFDNSDFTGWTGDPTELFKSPFSSSLVNSSGDNPKVLIIAFNRTVKGVQLGLGENNGGNFSNAKVSLLGSGGVERSLFNNSADITKRTSQRVLFEDEYFNSLKIEFFTADPVSLSNLIISKAKDIAVSSSPISPIFQTPSPFVYPDDVYTSIGDNWSNDLLNVFRYAEGEDIVNSSGDNPKSLLYTFKGAIASNALGLFSTSGTFSNAKVTLFQATTAKIIHDGSTDNTLINNLEIPISDIVAFNAVLIEFFTINTITLGAVSIAKNTLTDSVLRGENPSGEFRNVKTNIIGNLLVSLDEQKDAFGRLKIAEPFTIFDNSLTTELSDALFWSELINGTSFSIYDEPNANIDMSVAADADYIVRQTKQRFKYQPGKALLMDEYVTTPDGLCEIKNLKKGDSVFDGKGKITKIKGTAEWKDRRCYKITFDDGSIVNCDEDHEWVCIGRQNSQKGKQIIVSTREMVDKYGNYPTGFQRWRIPQSPILEFETKEVKIDPYTLGLILGDGHILPNGSVQFINADSELLNHIPYDVVKHTRKYGHGINGISKAIRYLELNYCKSYNKFIPFDYMYNSYETRLNTLKGLMDTDGTVDKRNGNPTYSSSSETLALGVAFLVRSIGGQAKISTKNPYYYDENGEKVYCRKNYIVTVISPVNPFRLERKAFYWKKRERISLDRYIHSIESIGNHDTKCIEVESNEHTFLVGNQIVTHNSHEFFITGLWATETGIRKRAGLCDYDNKGLGVITNIPQNGVFFENNNGVLSWNIAKNGVITETAIQENWNIDKLNGEGRSGFALNIDSVNILTCQLEWLGVGVVLVGFATGGGEIAYCHAFKHASQAGFVDTYMRTANLPVSYELTSITGSGAMKQICSSVISGGGFNPIGQTHAVQNDNSVSVLNNATELLVGIRLKEDSFEYTIAPGFLSILSESNGNTLWALCINPTYDGTVTWTDVAGTEVQQALNNNNQVSDLGTILARGSFSNNADSINQEVKSSVKIGKDLSGNIDELWLIVKALGNESYYGTINFKELI